MNVENQQRSEGCSASRPDRREFLKVAAAVSAMSATQAFSADGTPQPADAMMVGIYDRYSDQAGQNAALARRFGSRL